MFFRICALGLNAPLRSRYNAQPADSDRCELPRMNIVTEPLELTLRMPRVNEAERH